MAESVSPRICTALEEDEILNRYKDLLIQTEDDTKPSGNGIDPPYTRESYHTKRVCRYIAMLQLDERCRAHRVGDPMAYRFIPPGREEMHLRALKLQLESDGSIRLVSRIFFPNEMETYTLFPNGQINVDRGNLGSAIIKPKDKRSEPATSAASWHQVFFTCRDDDGMTSWLTKLLNDPRTRAIKAGQQPLVISDFPEPGSTTRIVNGNRTTNCRDGTEFFLLGSGYVGRKGPLARKQSATGATVENSPILGEGRAQKRKGSSQEPTKGQNKRHKTSNFSSSPNDSTEPVHQDGGIKSEKSLREQLRRAKIDITLRDKKIAKLESTLEKKNGRLGGEQVAQVSGIVQRAIAREKATAFPDEQQIKEAIKEVFGSEPVGLVEPKVQEVLDSKGMTAS